MHYGLIPSFKIRYACLYQIIHIFTIDYLNSMTNNMKKIFPILFSFLFILVSCSDNNHNDPDPGTDPAPDPTPKVNPYKTGKDLSSSTFVDWDNKNMGDEYFMLGYGYDATGKYAHPASVRGKILDMVKFAEDFGRINFFRSTSVGPELQIGRTLEECRESMGWNAGFSDSEIAKYKNLFKEKFASPFEGDKSFPDLSYQYLGISQVHVQYHLYFLYMSHMEKKIYPYLTEEFRNDLETKSADDVIKIYGTHILTSIKIGERIDYLYRYAEDENSNSYSWFLYNMHRYFSQGPSTWGSEPEKDPPLKENLYIEVVDGTRPDPNGWMVDITNYKGERIIFEGWKDITDANLTLVDFRNKDCLKPIYDFVNDPDKKEELIKAYEKYLSK